MDVLHMYLRAATWKVVILLGSSSGPCCRRPRLPLFRRQQEVLQNDSQVARRQVLCQYEYIFMIPQVSFISKQQRPGDADLLSRCAFVVNLG
jgi:hypothetical protein